MKLFSIYIHQDTYAFQSQPYQEMTSTPTGTSISVKNLFYNIPARRNFLKSDTVELRHITDEFHRVALAHPDIAFSMINNGSETFNLPKSNYRQRVVNIFGGIVRCDLIAELTQNTIGIVECASDYVEYGEEDICL